MLLLGRLPFGLSDVEPRGHSRDIRGSQILTGSIALLLCDSCMPTPCFSCCVEADSEHPFDPSLMPTQMINRRGQLVDCVATMRWHFGPMHGILAFRFTPLETYTPPSMGLSAPLNPPIASIISSMARDAAHRCAVSSVVATDQPLPMRAAPRPPLTAHLDDQGSWPLLTPSAAPSAPLQAWLDLPTACLGGSGEEGEPLPLQGLQPPPPPIASAPLTAQAGPRSSSLSQAAAPMAAGSAWPGWAAVAGEEASFPYATALQPSPQSPTVGVSGPPSLNDEEMQLLWDAIV
jgi:hypothetical protein